MDQEHGETQRVGHRDVEHVGHGSQDGKRDSIRRPGAHTGRRRRDRPNSGTRAVQELHQEGQLAVHQARGQRS